MWIEVDRPVKQLQRLIVSLIGSSVPARYPSQIVVVCIETISRLVPSPLDFCLFKLRRYGAHYARRDVVLKIKDIFQSVVEGIRPEVRSGDRIDKLPRDAHLIT